jgi:peptidylprolyl isomerase
METTTRRLDSTFTAVLALTISLSLCVAGGSVRGQGTKVDASKGQKMKQTESGLEYRDVKEGTGESPKAGQACMVHYTGWLWEDGKKGQKFDSSVDRGEPFSFAVGVGEVIKGWDEGVLTMKPGGKRELIIPAKLGYGSRGAGGVIPPNATLFFEVELLGLVKEPNAGEFKKTETGLQYHDVKEGSGPAPKKGQTCSVHYTGWLWENGKKGQKFDSSVDRGQAFSFPVGAGRVIKGWDEGVATMKVGGKRQLIIPAELGYGARGAGRVIPPGATLFFEVELLGVR